jgi:GNAT superfamily N-acetyltransferase
VSNELATYVWSGPIDAHLGSQLSEICVAATNAGGALGFLPPVSSDDIAPVADRTFARVNDGIDHLLTVRIDDMPIGWLLLERDPRPFASHWRTLKRLQVHPDHQGIGFGKALMEEAQRFAGDELGLEFLLLTVRGGTGVDKLYEKLGYEEVGRLRSAMRISDGDDRDEIFMVKVLR